MSTPIQQVHPSTRKPIRLVTVVEDRGSIVFVQALHGPLAGEIYPVTPEQLQRD